MEETITVVLAWIGDEHATQLTELQFQVQQTIGMDPNYVSLSAWRDSDLPERYAILLHHRSQEGSDLLAKLSEHPAFEQFARLCRTPPDIRPVRLDHRHGLQAGSVQIGQMMSMSVRRSEPGYGCDLELEVAGIFESLTYIDGYMGSAYGHNRAMDEEIVGLVYWTDRRPFDSSIPAVSPYEVKLYVRIG